MRLEVSPDSNISHSGNTTRAGDFELVFDGFLLACPAAEYENRFAAALSEKGTDCLRDMNGCFRGWARNTATGDITVFTDRFAGRELFVQDKNGTRIFHSDINELARETGAGPDPVGVTEFLLFQYPLYEKTTVHGISFFPPGGCMTYRRDTRKWEEKRYWKFRYREPDIAAGGDRAGALWELLRNAAAGCALEKNLVYGVGNSGGMDSRVALFTLAELGRKIEPFTIGKDPSDATHIAGRVAKALGLKNTIVPIAQDFLARGARELAAASAPNPAMLAWHVSSTQALPNFDVHITGFNGDNMMGSHLEPELFEINNRARVADYTFRHYSIAPDFAARVFRDAKFEEAVREHFAAGFEKSEQTKAENLFEEFNFNCRQIRFIKNSPNFDFLGRFQWRSPFIENDVMDFMLQMTGAERLGLTLYREMAGRFLGPLNKIRYERQGSAQADAPMVAKMKDRVFDIDRKIRRKTGRSLIFKGSHKRVESEMLTRENFEFISRIFKKPCEVFDTMFDSAWINEHLEMMFKTSPVFSSSVLTMRLRLNDPATP